MVVLTVNSGSSSLKACLFDGKGARRDFHYRQVNDLQQAFDRLLQDLQGQAPDIVGHRIVHGGDTRDAARKVDAEERARLQSLVPLAPLHLPGNLLGLDLCSERFAVPQIACFDTAFHCTLPELARRLPIPQSLGLRRYGFHGLNYAHVARILPGLLGDKARKNIVVAHLGSGASLCLLQGLQSIDTTMGYTPAGGIVMGTRSGDLDPGVMVELAARHTPQQLRDLVFHHMGLLALSDGLSDSMSSLIDSPRPEARFAVEYFCQQVRAAIGALAAKQGGVEALVFTGGIGENSATVREKICGPLEFLGFKLDPVRNQASQTSIELTASRPILVIPADEEHQIYDLCLEWQ